MADIGNVDLVIKNPSLPDTEFRTSVPLASSVRELKEEIHRTHPCRPPVTEQKIIFAGKVLHDADELHGHMAWHDTSTPITLHLVIRQASASLPLRDVPAAAPPPMASPTPARPVTDEPEQRPMARPGAAARAPTVDPPPPPPPPGYAPVCYGVVGQQLVWYELNGQPYVFAMPVWQPITAPFGAPGPGAPGALAAPLSYDSGAYYPQGWTPPPAFAWSGMPGVPPPAAHGAAGGTQNGPPQHTGGAGIDADAPEGGAGRGAAARPAAAADPAAADAVGHAVRRDAVQLAMKLVLLVFMLGQDGDTDRLLVLSAVAALIFLFQTNQLAGLLPSFRPAAQAGAQPAAPGAGTHTPPGAQQPHRHPPSALHSFAILIVAFFSSLFPGWQLQPAPLPEEHVPPGGDGAYDGDAPPANLADLDAGAAAQAQAAAADGPGMRDD